MRSALMLAFVAILLPSAAAAGVADDARAAANEFLLAYGTGDSAAQRAMWSEKVTAAERAYFAGFQQVLRTKCVDLVHTSIDSISGDEAKATVAATVVRDESYRSGPPEPRLVPRRLLITLERQDGRWRVTS